MIKGGGVVIEALDLDGALIITAVPGANVTVRRLRVANAGWPIVPLAPGASSPDWVRIRGFTVHRTEARTLKFDTPGDFVVDEAD